MAVVSLANTSANLSGKTAVLAEMDSTITGLHTFNRGTGAPFAVNTGSTKVYNLDADKLDGLDSAALVQVANVGWVALTPVLAAIGGGTVSLNTLNGCQFLAIGKMLTVSFYLVVNLAGNISDVTLALPAGFTSSTYGVAPMFVSVFTGGIVQVAPNGTVLNFYKDSNLSVWPSGAITVGGVMTLSVY